MNSPAGGRKAAMLVCLALAAGACSARDGSSSGALSMRVTPVAGPVRVIQGDQSKLIKGSYKVTGGDRVEMPTSSTATLRVEGGARLELAGADLVVGSPSRFRLFSGKVLVRSTSKVLIEGDSWSVRATKSVFRVDKGLATRVANYAGDSAVLASFPYELAVAASRQAIAAGGVLPKATTPLHFSAADPWDRILLSDAIDLDARLVNFARGLEAQLGPLAGSDFLRRVAPQELGLNSFAPLATSRRSDILIGLMMSVESGRSWRASLDDRFSRVFGLWSEGATWGLIAHEFGVASGGLFSRLTEAINQAKISVIGPGPALLAPRIVQRSSPRSGAQAPQPPATPGATASASKAPARPAAILPPGLTELVPDQLKTIVDDLYGVLDPIATLPRIT